MPIHEDISAKSEKLFPTTVALHAALSESDSLNGKGGPGNTTRWEKWFVTRNKEEERSRSNLART